MRTKITIISIFTLLLLLGCGDEKSTGERMSDAVSKIRGDKPKPKLLIPKHSDKKLEPIIQEEEKVVEKVEINTTKEEAKKSDGISLKDIALKAKEQIKEAAKPAKELKQDMKSALSIVKESVKEVVSETKESVKETVSKATPLIEKGKDKLRDEAKKIKDLIDSDKKPANQ